MPIVLPDMESVTEGVVVEWRAAVGDAVAADQIVVEVSTDKVDLEVPAPAAGRLVSIAVEAGETFTVGQPLGEIAAGAGAPAAPPPPVVRQRRRRHRRPPRPRRGPAGSAPCARGPTPSGRRSRRSHAALPWRRASIPGGLTGTGPGGIIRKPDVLAAATRRAPRRRRPRRGGGSAPVGAGEEAVPLRGPAAALAGYMDESLSIPTATSFRTISVAVLDAQRRQINDAAEGGRALREALVHPPDRLGHRAGGRRAAVHDDRLRRWSTASRTSWCATA